jgi:foldase protein PrsA
LDQLVTEHILMQEARKNKIEATKEEVQARIDQDKLAVGGEQAYLEILKNQIKMSEKEYQAEVEKQIIVEKLYQQIVAGQTVTDEEIQKYYQENQSQYLVPMQIRARHILVATEEEAKTILNELKAGADFAQLALDKSIDPSAKQNQGDLGFFAEDASFVPEFKDAAFKLKVGEISAPIKTEYGYHIIKVEEQKESHQQSFEEVKASIAEELRASRESEKFEQYVEELRQQAKIDKEELPVPTPVNQPADSSPVNQEPAAPQDEAAQSTPNTSE